MRKYTVAADVGGTFTDGIAIDSEGSVFTAKVQSTPNDPSIGFLKCVEHLAKHTNQSVEDFLTLTSLIVHGTTISLNILLTKQGSKTALITTKGFRDLFEMRRSQRDFLFDLQRSPPQQLVPRHLRFVVEERVDYSGKILIPINREDVKRAIRKMKEEKVESIAVCLLHSYANASHEKNVQRLISSEFPTALVSLSSEILPLIREYERTSTVVVNAYVRPAFQRYSRNLTSKLSSLGFSGHFLFMHSGGGVMTPEGMERRAVCSLISGPAAAPSAAIFLSELIGSENILTIDMGGTSFDVARVYRGTITTTTENVIDRYTVSIPTVEVHTIGAGGGSIAWIDDWNLLHVGPKSAGAAPGPVCYRKGGTEPTVVDANIVLGYLNPKYFLGGEIVLDATASYNAIKMRIADPLGLSATDAAAGVFNLVNDNMIGALRTVTAKRGDDPTEFVLVAGGGAGPTHCCALAKGIGMKRIFVPKLASFLCALGMLTSDLKYDLSHSRPSRLADTSATEIRQSLDGLKAEGDASLEQSGVDETRRSFRFSLDMRYVKQVHEVEVAIDERNVDLKELASSFHKRHEEMYTYKDLESEIEIVSYKVTATGKRDKVSLQPQAFSGKNADTAIKGYRDVFFEGSFQKTAVYDGSKLAYGNLVQGPAVVEDITTTVVVEPNSNLMVDQYGNYSITLV